jgi:hypothetical protein
MKGRVVEGWKPMGEDYLLEEREQREFRVKKLNVSLQ